MESSPETDSDLGQSEPWVMLEDSDIEICDEPSKAKEKEASVQKESTLNEPPQNEQEEEEEEDDFAKLRKHRKCIEQLDATSEAEDLSWDPSDIATSAATPVVENTKIVCTKCSICSVLLTKGGSKLASYLCNTFLALCVLAVASGAAYYFQLPNQLSTINLKNVLARYTHPDYAMRYDKYIDPKYEKNKQIYFHEENKYSNYKKYEDTTRKHEKKMKKERQYDNREDYKQRDYKKEYKEKKRYNKNTLDEKRYDRKDYEKKAYKQEYKQKKNSKSKGDYKRK